jgi:hypothetical protein
MCLVFLTFQWHLALHRWADGLPYLGSQAVFWDALLAIGTLTACLAIMLLSQHNARRVVINTFIIMICSTAGLLFGGLFLDSRYDFDDGGAERGCLVFGILGTLLGWVCTMARTPLHRA